MKLTGREAIEYAEANNLTLNKYADPTEDGRVGLSIVEANDVASEDSGLIFLPEIVRCDCGQATGERCEWVGPKSETVTITWMPEHLRASHDAAGNWGEYPANGSIRLRVEKNCAKLLSETIGDGD